MRAGGSAVRLDSTGVDSRGLAAKRRAGAADQRGQLVFGEPRELAQAPDAGRPQLARQRQIDAGQHLDLERGEEPRLIAVEHVDDAAGSAQL